MFTVLPNAFAGPTADAPPVADDPQVGVNLQVVTNDELQTRLLNTLDNAEGVAAGIGMTAILGDQIEAARASVLSATPQQLEAIPPNLYNSLKILEMSSGQMRLAYDPELRTKTSEKSTIQQVGQGMTIQSAGGSYDETALDEPGYPGQDWNFSFEGGEPDGDEDDVDGGSGESHGSCHAPGSTYPARVAALNSAIVANAVNDIADHFCEFVVLGFNVAPLCVVTEVVAAIAVGIDENMSLCNEHIGAAEVSATWIGLKTVHGNVQHVHDDLANVDDDLASHDAAINLQISTHDTDINTQLSTHDTDIKSQVSTHDTDIKSQVSTHDTDIKSQVSTHDTEIKSQVAIHDLDLKFQLATHDADIKARLGEIQGTVDENQRLIMISMARQDEILRLLITPSGRREINPDVLSCTGDDCPQADIVLSCENGLDWPCK
jgi:hypothetical protein